MRTNRLWMYLRPSLPSLCRQVILGLGEKHGPFLCESVGRCVLMGSQGPLVNRPEGRRPKSQSGIRARGAVHRPTLVAKKDLGRYEKLLNTVIEGISVFVFGAEGHVAYLLRQVPRDPTSGVVFVAILLVIMFITGVHLTDEKDKHFCLQCMLIVVLLGVGLVLISLKHGGGNGRLSEMHEDRAHAIHPKPFHYPPQ